MALWEEALQIAVTRGEIMLVDRGATEAEIEAWRDEYLVDLAADRERFIAAFASFFADPERDTATHH
ncbi:hypothetical protein ATO4_09107 [Aurantimonas sp. 22II-16-19i]|nr:hypothetical protein ATO4_09107 [Aurantimonas sp. 22II-16-19i]